MKTLIKIAVMTLTLGLFSSTSMAENGFVQGHSGTTSTGRLPEPSALALLGSGLLSVAAYLRNR